MSLETLTLFSVVVALLAVYLARRANTDAREAFITDMRGLWNEQLNGWNLLLMILYGSDFHYAYVNDDARDRAGRLTAELMSEETSYSAAASARIEILPVSQFLAAAGDALIRGRWRINEAYDVFGPNAARHYAAILWLAHRPEVLPTDWDGEPGTARWADLGEEGNLYREQIPEFNTFDQQDCLVVLAMAMRAEQCRRGDTYAHFNLQLARALRGEPAGEELYRSLKRASRVRRPNFVGSLLLRRLFRFSARPRLTDLFRHEGSPIVGPTEYQLIRRRPWETRQARSQRVERVLRQSESQ